MASIGQRDVRARMPFVLEASITVVVVVSGLALVSYVVFEEDSMLDLTDFNITHALLFVVALASVCSECSVKAAWGAWVESDRAVFLYALFKSLSLVLYFGLIWLVFFKHVMAPMLIDDIDDGYAFLSCADALSVCGILCVLLLVTLGAVGHATAAAHLRSLPLWCLTSVVGIVVAGFVLVNAFYDAPSSAAAPRSRFAVGVSSYTRSRFGVVGGFDWHCARSIPTALMFIEFISQLWLLLSALVIVTISVFAIFAAIFIGDIGCDSSEVRLANGWLKASIMTGQLLASLIAALLAVNFVHDVALMAIGGLSPE